MIIIVCFLIVCINLYIFYLVCAERIKINELVKDIDFIQKRGVLLATIHRELTERTIKRSFKND